jgi:hypothetical protein
MIELVYFLFFILVLVQLLVESSLISKKTSFYIYFFVLIPLMIFKDGSIMPDYYTYKGYYLDIINSNSQSIDIIEITYYIISLLFSYFKEAGFYFVLGVYSTLQLILMHKFIEKNSPYYGYSMLFYFVNFFLIFGLIQIRAGVALGFILYGITRINEKKVFFKSIIAATFFHYSSFVFITLIFLPKLKISRARIYLFLFISFLINKLLPLLMDSIVSLMPFTYLERKLITYSLVSRTESFEINFFSPFILSKILLLLIFSFFIEKIRREGKNSIFMLKMYLFGVCIYISLASIPELAVRLSNMLFLSEIILLPYFINMFVQQKVIKVILILFAFFILYINVNFLTYFNYSL